jgi:hypothetical protein
MRVILVVSLQEQLIEPPVTHSAARGQAVAYLYKPATRRQQSHSCDVAETQPAVQVNYEKGVRMAIQDTTKCFE